MSETETTEYEPVRVHVVADSTATPATPRRMAVTYRTIVLTTTSPVQNLLGTDPSRCHVLVQATTNDVVLAATEAQAQDAANQASGIPAPDGFLLPHANTAPARLETTEQLWAAAATYPAIVSLAIAAPAP